MSGLKPEHDGAIIRVGMRDGGSQTLFMVREPGQIKSATGNRGTFDPADPDIRYRARDESPTAERIGNALKSVTVGVRDKSGIVVQDEVDAAALLGQAAGFSPSSVRNSFEGKSAIVQHDRALQARRSALVEQFAMAAMAGDEEGKAAAREDIAKFNGKNPSRRIQAMQLAQSVNMRQKRIREAEEGVYLPSKRWDAMEAGRFAVPG